MALLRARFRGAIHLLASSEGGVPDIEFDGEGPEQIMDRIQGFAVPWIQKAIDAAGPSLLWEEIDREASRVRRRRSLIDSRLEFEIAADDQGIELLPSGDGATAPGRVWVPLDPLAEPGRKRRAALGWNVGEPRFLWRYVIVGATPTIEMTWSCAGIHRGWADEVRRRLPVLRCRLDDEHVCQLSPVHEEPLSYRGHFPVPRQDRLSPRRRISLEHPLVVTADDAEARCAIDGDVPVTAEALDFRALFDDRTTRLVSLDDLPRRFEAEVVTSEETLLPAEIPAGWLPGVPWTLAVEPRESPRPAAAGNGGVSTHPAVSHRRRWALKPRGDAEGYWGQVEWEGYPPLLRFALGAADAGRAPAISRIRDRRANVGWRIGTGGGDDELLCFSIPHWMPAGDSGCLALPCGGAAADYASEVRARLDGLEERFTLDSGSEVAANRIFLDPRSWRFCDESRGVIEGAEALGEVSGYVRWRRPAHATNGDDPLREGSITPTDWAGGGAPALLIRRPGADGGGVVDWGGLYAPESVPWEGLEEVRPELAGDGLALTPRAAAPAIWISLWGFVCRYDRHQLTFVQRRRQKVTAWISPIGLELFPRAPRKSPASGFLLRSFSPLYAVADAEPRVFRLEPGSPRPVLRVGRELHEAGGLRSLEIGEGTRVRFQVTAPEGTPESFHPGRIPETPLHLPGGAGRRMVWLALEQPGEGGEGSRRAGYLLSWDAAAGFRFRGFFAHPDAMVELGGIRRADQRRRVFLGSESRAGRRAFRLEIGTGGHRWSESAPARVVERVSSEMIAEWERRYFARDRPPAPLAEHEVRILRQPVDEGPWIFELLERRDVPDLDPPPGIRVWEPQQDADEEILATVRRLGDDQEETEEAEPGDETETRHGTKKILKADDDDDDF